MQIRQIHMNQQKLTGVLRSSRCYVFIRSHLLWYKIMFNKCGRDLLLLKIKCEKFMNWMWGKQKQRVKYRVKYTSKKENDNWRHTSCPDRWRSPVIIWSNVRFSSKESVWGRGVDWESIKDNYKTIREISVSNLPTETGSEECAHSTDFFTGERIASKIKEIRAKYRKAFDAGRQSGECRIVATFYDLYSEIWSGSPATESI